MIGGVNISLISLKFSFKISPVKRLSIDSVIIVLGVFTVIAVTENWQYRSTSDLQKRCSVTKFSWYYLCLSLFCKRETFGFFFFFAKHIHCVKIVRIRSYSGPHFAAFGLNTERYSVSLHIQSKYWKIHTRITPNPDTFHALHPS